MTAYLSQFFSTSLWHWNFCRRFQTSTLLLVYVEFSCVMAYSGIQIWTSNRGQITDGFERKTGTPVILGESRELSGTVVLARKHDMPYRMCLVYLNMTSWQRRMPYHFLGWMTCWRPWVRISGFSNLDLASGSVKEEDRPKTAFSAQQGQFH